jgi:putative addiction module CopG family antidote
MWPPSCRQASSATGWLGAEGFDRTASGSYTGGMDVHLTPDQKAFIRQAIETGRYSREEDAVQEALSLWEERERTRAEILASVEEAEASLARGEGRTITQESLRELADTVKRRGRARLASDPTVR